LTLVEKAELALQSPRDAKEKVAILVCLGKWYGLELDRPDRAYERLVDASKIDPADQRARRVRAALFRRFGNRQAALRELQEAMRGRVSVEERAEINTEIGDMLMDDASQDSGGAGVARKHYTEALEARPEYVPALGGLVRVHAELEEWRGLANVLERRLKLTDDDDALAADHVRLAELYEKNLGEPQKAAQHYRDILLSSEPTSPATMSAHWKAEASLERLARQLGLWRDLVEIARAHVAAGRTHDARKLLDEAAAILSARRGGRKADFAVVHEGLGALHEAEQDAPRAALEFQLAYDLDPASPRTLRGCGDLAYAAGDLDRARAMFEGMLKLPLGGRSGATKADVLCRLGEIAEQRSELPVAKERAERALQLEPGHARANALRARLR
jgi:tetratricopeptide (TPR) repeat protein